MAEDLNNQRESIPEREERSRQVLIKILRKVVSLHPLDFKNNSLFLDEKTFIHSMLPKDVELEDLLVAFCNCGFNFEITGRYQPSSREILIGRSRNHPNADGGLLKEIPLKFVTPGFAPGTVKNSPSLEIVFHTHIYNLTFSAEGNSEPSLDDQKQEANYSSDGKRFISVIASGAPSTNTVIIYQRLLDKPLRFPKDFFIKHGINDPLTQITLTQQLSQEGWWLSEEYLTSSSRIQMTPEQIDNVLKFTRKFSPIYRQVFNRFGIQKSDITFKDS